MLYPDTKSDTLAKDGGKLPLTSTSISFEEAKTLINLIDKNKCKKEQEHSDHQRNDSYRQLNGEEVSIRRLWTWYSRLTVQQIQVKISWLNKMAVDHILQVCTLYYQQRRQIRKQLHQSKSNCMWMSTPSRWRSINSEVYKSTSETYRRNPTRLWEYLIILMMSTWVFGDPLLYDSWVEQLICFSMFPDWHKIKGQSMDLWHMKGSQPQLP